MRLLLVLILWVWTSTAAAEVYRCVRDGRTVYTDRPCSKGAKPAELPEINFVTTPGASKSNATLAKEWDERTQRDKQTRARADAAWIKEHDEKQSAADKVRAGLMRRKVVKGMSPDQVREILGEPDATTQQEGRENITVWSYKPKEGPQYTISFRGGEVNSVSSRKGKKKS